MTSLHQQQLTVANHSYLCVTTKTCFVCHNKIQTLSLTSCICLAVTCVVRNAPDWVCMHGFFRGANSCTRGASHHWSHMYVYWNIWDLQIPAGRQGVKVSRFLCSSTHRYYAQPAITIQKAQNLTIAFRFITEVEKIPVVNIGEFSTLFREVVG